MDQPDFDAAAARLAVQTLQAQLTANRNAAKAHYRQQSRRHERAGRGGLGPAGQKATLAVYLLSGHNIELATVMAQRLSSFQNAQTPGYPSAATVESLFLAAPMSEICQAHAPETPAWVTATQQAQAFLAENSTMQWVETMNVGHGVTPSSVDVFLQCEGALLGHQPDLGAPSKRTVNKWAARWRLRWGVRRKTLQPEGYIEPEELRTKARKARALFWARKMAPETCPANGLCYEADPKSGQVLGPSFREVRLGLFWENPALISAAGPCFLAHTSPRFGQVQPQADCVP